jgi:hypothetical protein
MAIEKRMIRAIAASNATVYSRRFQMVGAKANRNRQRARRRKPLGLHRQSKPLTHQKYRRWDRLQKPASTKLAAAKVSKKEMVLVMLRKSEGASLAAIMAATGWQEHSVRGFFAAVVKRKLKLNLVSRKVGNLRIYQIESPDPER